MATRSAHLLIAALIVGIQSTSPLRSAVQPVNVGTIQGRVRLMGRPPGNTVIRMGVDPMCVASNGGRRRLQEVVLTSPDGGLANVFVHVQGSFPGTPVPSAPVTIDQRGCVYVPRVVGARAGQTLEVRNSDALLHNVRGVSRTSNSFNVGQPLAGMSNRFTLTSEEVMLRVECNIHRWMTAYVGVVTHPYFAVSGVDGSFTIRGVPVGRYTLETWHERFGTQTQPVRIQPGATTTLDVQYTGTGRPGSQG
jgi:hypothetical protein